MLYSSFAQVLFLIILAFLLRKHLQNNQLNYVSNDLLIKDIYTTDTIGSYYILGNKYALDLELHNIGDEKKLDAVTFSERMSDISKSYKCENFDNSSFKICKLSNNKYVGISAIKLNENILGYVIAKKNYVTDYNFPVIYDLFVILIIVLSYFIFNFIFIFSPMKTKIAKNTRYLLEFIQSKFEDISNLEKINIYEYKKIFQSFIENKDEVVKLKKEHEYYETIKEITLRVAHDIRSPTTTLNNIIENTTTLSEERKELIIKATNSINEISNNLLKDYAKNKIVNNELIFTIIDNILTSKKQEHSNKDINFLINVTNDSYCCFSKISINSFERLLSNLINNSVESIKHKKGLITLSLYSTQDTIFITIEDNGAGIPNCIIHRVTEQGFSYGKESGTGLGLYYAKEQIKSFNGDLLIESQFSIGTKITIQLKREIEETWFCKNLIVPKNSNILLIHNDFAVHEMWDKQFKNESSIKVFNFYDLENLNEEIINKINAQVYLIYNHTSMDVLDIISKYGIQKKSIIITNNFEDNVFQKMCLERDVKILPKAYVPYLNIEIEESYIL